MRLCLFQSQTLFEGAWTAVKINSHNLEHFEPLFLLTLTERTAQTNLRQNFRKLFRPQKRAYGGFQLPHDAPDGKQTDQQLR